MSDYTTRVTLPKDARRHLTFEQFDELLTLMRRYAGAEVGRNKDLIPTSVLLIFDGDLDPYDLALAVVDLERELNSWGCEGDWMIPKPEKVAC